MAVRKPKVGDVFAIPVGDGRFGFTQVVATYGGDGYYFAVFGVSTDGEGLMEQVDEALAGPLQFLALSLDAKVHAGHWEFLCHAAVPENLPLPAYKESVSSHDHVDVVDYSGTRRRRATRDEATWMPNRKVVAPVRLERALRASLGLEPWIAAYDELRPLGPTSRDAFA